jgi:hypothetical protein
MASKGDVPGLEALGDLTERLQHAEDVVQHGAVDRGRFEALGKALTTFNQRAARWTEKVSAADVRAFLEQLDMLLDEM